MRPLARRLWAQSPPLVACALLMSAAFLASTAGILADSRMITGVPARLKPAKFAISTAIFSATMAWLYQYIHIWPRFKRLAGWIFAAVLVLEVAIIDLQAARGTTSHFNVSTPLDSTLYSVMGIAIVILSLFSVGIVVALFRQRFEDPPWGWSLRSGMLISVLGMASAGFMIAPTPEQSAAMAARERVTTVGAHTVGAPDGGEGMPFTNWSRHHGDLRVPHFLGLHAIQILPLFGWLFSSARRGAGPVLAVAASYLTLFAILAAQALRGESIQEPRPETLTALAIWLAASAAIVAWSARNSKPRIMRAGA